MFEGFLHTNKNVTHVNFKISLCVKKELIYFENYIINIW